MTLKLESNFHFIPVIIFPSFWHCYNSCNPITVRFWEIFQSILNDIIWPKKNNFKSLIAKETL